MNKLTVLSCAALSVIAVPISTQANNKPPVALEEIIITAQKREQTLRDVPGSVVAINAQTLQRTVTSGFSELAAQAPGVEIVGANDGFGKAIRIRGIGTNAFVSSVPPSVGIFIDDIPLVTIESAFNDLADVERVEVLKGPQSTLFGKGVSSGLIDITTKRPYLDTVEAFVEVNFGNRDREEYRLGGNLPIGDSIALRASLYDVSEEGDISNRVTGNKGGTFDSDGGRLRLLWEPFSELSVVLGFERHDTDTVGTRVQALEYGDFFSTLAFFDPAINLQPAEPGSRKNQDSIEGLRASTTEVSSLHIDWELSDTWSLHSVSSVQDWSQQLVSGQATARAGFASGVGPAVLNPGTTRFNDEALTQELRLNYDGDELSTVVGLFYGDTEQSFDTQLARARAVIPASALAPGFPADLTVLNLAIVAASERDTNELGVFVHNVWTLSDRHELTFGLRYSDIETEDTIANRLGVGSFADMHGAPGFPAFPVSNWQAPRLTESWQSITGGVKLSYAATDSMNVYISYDRGFKPGGFTATNHNSADVSGNSFIAGEAFDEETTDALEFGLKGMFFADTVAWNAAVFYQLYNDYQISVIDRVTANATIDNAGEVLSQGFEMDFQWLVNENLIMAANLSYVDSRYEKYQGAECIRPQYRALACTETNDTQDLSGKRVNNISPWTSNVNVTWNDVLTDKLSWFARGEVLFRDDRIYGPDLDPGTKAASYYLLNASAGISSDSGWETLLWVKNLADEDYFTELRANTDGNTVMGLRGTQGFARSYGVELSLRF